MSPDYLIVKTMLDEVYCRIVRLTNTNRADPIADLREIDC
jgi:hypothetical protein